LRRPRNLSAAKPKTTSARAAAVASAGTYEGPPVLANAVAVAVAVALGLTVDAAEMVAAAVEPAVAVGLVGVGLAVADGLAAEDVCARAAELNTITALSASIQASIVSAANGTELFLLNTTSSLLLTFGDDLLTSPQ
jgi:hypothetical protein